MLSSQAKYPVRSVVVVVFPGFQLLDAIGPVQVFVTATEQLSKEGEARPYRVRVVSATGGLVVSSAGLQVMTEVLPRANST